MPLRHYGNLEPSECTEEFSIIVSDSEFQVVKAAAVGAALLLAGTVQVLLPYRHGLRDLVGNWKVNLPLAVLNAILLGLVCGGCACLVAQWAVDHRFGLANQMQLGMAGSAAISIVALDFTAYAWHRANHHLKFLWRFHAVHHSDRFFDTSTGFRFHVGEIAVSLVVRVTVVALLGIPVAGILAFEVIYAFFNLFEHGNIRLPLRLERSFGRIFVTPALHRKHHSSHRRELNSNYGTIFSVWDRLFKTRLASSSSEAIEVGLPGDAQAKRGLAALLAMPFSNHPTS